MGNRDSNAPRQQNLKLKQVRKERLDRYCWSHLLDVHGPEAVAYTESRSCSRQQVRLKVSQLSCAKVDPELTSCTREDVASWCKQLQQVPRSWLVQTRFKFMLLDEVSYHLCCDGGIMESQRRIGHTGIYLVSF